MLKSYIERDIITTRTLHEITEKDSSMKRITLPLPLGWHEISFGKSLALAKCKNFTEELSCLSGVPVEDIKNGKIANLETALLFIASLKRIDPPTDLPKTILGYTVPDDLMLEETGRYEDLKIIVEGMESNPGPDQLVKYTEIVGVFTQPNYLTSNEKQRKEFADKFLNAPCKEVVAIGNFIVMKLRVLRTGIPNNSPKSLTRMKKIKLASRAWLKNMAFTIRFALLKRRSAFQETNS